MERLPLQQRSAAASLRLHSVRRPDGRNKAPRPPAFARLNADGKSFSVKIRPTEMRHNEIRAPRIKTSATSADTVWGGGGGGIIKGIYSSSHICHFTHFLLISMWTESPATFSNQQNFPGVLQEEEKKWHRMMPKQRKTAVLPPAGQKPRLRLCKSGSKVISASDRGCVTMLLMSHVWFYDLCAHTVWLRACY